MDGPLNNIMNCIDKSLDKSQKVQNQNKSVDKLCDQNNFLL